MNVRDELILRSFIVILTSMVLCVTIGTGLARADAPYKVGETVTYAIKKFGVKAGEATLVYQGPVTFHGVQFHLITFKAESLNFLDEENIYVTPKTFYPALVERNLNIFGKKEKIFEQYDAGQGSVTVTKVAGGKTTTETIKGKGKGPLDNIYTFIFRYRQNGKFTVGETLTAELPTKSVNFKVVSREQVKIAGEKRDAFFLESDSSDYRVWFDTTDKKIPLMIDGALGIAKMTMLMAEYKP